MTDLDWMADSVQHFLRDHVALEVGSGMNTASSEVDMRMQRDISSMSSLEDAIIRFPDK